MIRPDAGSPRLRRLLGASLPAFGDAGPMSRSKSLFLIKRWEIKSKHHSYRIPKSVCFLHVPFGFKSLLQSLRGLTADAQSSLRALPGHRAVVWPICFFQKGPAAPEESRMLSPFPPDLKLQVGQRW